MRALLLAWLVACSPLVYDLPPDLGVRLDCTAPPAALPPSVGVTPCREGVVAWTDGGRADSLDEAVQRAWDGEVIWICPGVHRMADTVEVRWRDLTFAAASGLAEDTVLNGSNQRILAVQDSAVALHNLTLVGGAASEGAGIWASGSVVHLVNSSVSYNVATARGGGLLAENAAVWSVDTEWAGNTAERGGGAAFVDACVTLEQTVAVGNDASSHGGGMWFGGSSSIEASGASWIANKALWGGGLAIEGISEATLDALSAWSGNSAVLGGGGLWLGPGAGQTLHLMDVRFENNRAGGAGGALMRDGWGPLEIAISGAFEANSAFEGGAMWFDADEPVVLGLDGARFIDQDAAQTQVLELGRGALHHVSMQNTWFSSKAAAADPVVVSQPQGRLEARGVQFADLTVPQRLHTACGVLDAPLEDFVCDNGVWGSL